jgi:hypothetical protein
MFAILHALGGFVTGLFKSRCRLEAENLLLRHQLIIALRRAPPRLPGNNYYAESDAQPWRRGGFFRRLFGGREASGMTNPHRHTTTRDTSAC